MTLTLPSSPIQTKTPLDLIVGLVYICLASNPEITLATGVRSICCALPLVTTVCLC
jgi:hypothetical protein